MMEYHIQNAETELIFFLWVGTIKDEELLYVHFEFKFSVDCDVVK